MSLLTGLAYSFGSLCLLRFLTGIGEGAYFSNDRAIISAYTPERRKGLGQGISYIGLGFGIFVGISLAGVISDLWGWRSVFILFAFPSFLASFLIYRVVEQPHWQEFKGKGEKKFSYSMVFKNRDLWLLYVGGIPGVYALWVLGTWAPAMFKEIGVETLARSSLYASILGVSGIPGVVLTGLVSDRLSRKGKGRKGLIAIEFFLMSLCMLLLGCGLKLKVNIYVFVFLFFIIQRFTHFFQILFLMKSLEQPMD
jgi:predicted MFS family arabinose efflux permease